jgi:hypothetical protein
MNDDGHFIDDPLMVVNTKPDFSGLGIPTERHQCEPLTLQYLIGDIPDWIKILPKDWKGETTRATIHFAVSNLAIENAKFDTKGFVSEKFVKALRRLKEKCGLDEICLTNRFSASIDSITDDTQTFFCFHVEFAGYFETSDTY